MKVTTAIVLFFALAVTARAAEAEVIKNQWYYSGKDADPNQHRLDHYLPKGHKDFPVLFFVHGGGYTSGNKSCSTNRHGPSPRRASGSVIVIGLAIGPNRRIG